MKFTKEEIAKAEELVGGLIPVKIITTHAQSQKMITKNVLAF